MDQEKPILLVTMGDPCGIGPEILALSEARNQSANNSNRVFIGNTDVLKAAIALRELQINVHTIHSIEEALFTEGTVNILDPGNLDATTLETGVLSGSAGKASVEWIELAGKLLLANKAQAMVTAPINKEAVQMASIKTIGHMEILQKLSGAKNVATMLISGNLSVVHLSTHVALKNAHEAVTIQNITSKLSLTNDFFGQYFNVKPSIGVASFNPHNGDGGLMGNEESMHIIPAIEQARSLGIDVHGPIPADTIFTLAIRGQFNAVLAMYHDQGHIPIKVHGWEQSVSVTIGLPFLRTSVDHGTAFDIAGKGIADPASMIESIHLAETLLKDIRGKNTT